MSRVIIQDSSYQNIDREEVKDREIRYLPNLSIVNLLSVYILGKVETPYYISHLMYPLTELAHM